MHQTDPVRDLMTMLKKESVQPWKTVDNIKRVEYDWLNNSNSLRSTVQTPAQLPGPALGADACYLLRLTMGLFFGDLLGKLSLS